MECREGRQKNTIQEIMTVMNADGIGEEMTGAVMIEVTEVVMVEVIEVITEEGMDVTK